MTFSNPFIPVILSGGVGSRLWPVSRTFYPKPFMSLPNGLNLLQTTFQRIASLEDVAAVLTVTNQELFLGTQESFRAVNQKNLWQDFILEPFGRNTAASVALATLYVKKRYGKDAHLLISPADHLISHPRVFQDAVLKARLQAEKGKLVVFGIQPETPETGYGYIEAEGTEVLQFVEKPGPEKAQEYLNSGRFYWNSGLFCFRADVIEEEMKRHCPQIWETAASCLETSSSIPLHQKAEGQSFLSLDSHLFQQVPQKSIDYALMEKSSNIALIPCPPMGWNDVGSWEAFRQTLSWDAQGNAVEGEVALHETENCYIRSDTRLVATLGLKNLLIVDTPDALLVADLKRSQEVRTIYESLIEKKHPAAETHQTVYRPWGHYTVLGEGPGFKVKKISVKPGGRLSLQMHQYRNEHWTVVSGTAFVVNNTEEFYLETNHSTYIPATHKHRLENKGDVDLVMIEVQSGSYLGEDDIVRFEDIYGRTLPSVFEKIDAISS